jgi:hypothetical protein
MGLILSSSPLVHIVGAGDNHPGINSKLQMGENAGANGNGSVLM